MFSKLRNLKKQLKEASKREKKALAGGEREEYRAARDETLMYERAIASAKGEEFAEPIEFPLRWDTGAPLPHLFINDYKSYLTFYVNDPDPNWDGTYVTVVDPKSENPASIALIEFAHCQSAKLGAPNEEVFHGHPLTGKGLELYEPLIVKNSRWINEIKNINKTHHYYKEEVWKKYNHYLFGFHDTTFECIAESFSVELYNKNMGDVIKIVSKKLIG